MEENDRLQKQVSHLVYENGFFRQHTPQNVNIFSLKTIRITIFKFYKIDSSSFFVLQTTLPSKDTSCESVVTSHLTQNPPQDASPAGLVTTHSYFFFVFLYNRIPFPYQNLTFCRLLSIAEETLTEFLSKATGTAVEWVQMPGMKVSNYPISIPNSPLLLLLPLHFHFNFIDLSLNHRLPSYSLVRIPLESSLYLMVALVWQHEPVASLVSSLQGSLKSSRIAPHGIEIAELWMSSTCYPPLMVEPSSFYTCR